MPDLTSAAARVCSGLDGYFMRDPAHTGLNQDTRLEIGSVDLAGVGTLEYLGKCLDQARKRSRAELERCYAPGFCLCDVCLPLAEALAPPIAFPEREPDEGR